MAPGWSAPLISFMLDRHSAKGYTEVMPPILVNSASLTGSASCPNSPKKLPLRRRRPLAHPTAEVPLTSLHRDEVIAVEQLPLKYAAYTPASAVKPAAMGATPAA